VISRGFGRAYGCQLLEVDGNHVLDCYAATAEAAAACRAGEGPVILVATTFRMGGHATHDEREGRALFDASTWAYWGQRDPIGCYETWLIEEKGIEPTRLTAIEAAVGARIEAAAAQALSRRESHAPDPATVTHGVYGGAAPGASFGSPPSASPTGGPGGGGGGLPPGLRIDFEALQADLDRRRPGQSALTTPRDEADRVQVVSGVFEGETTGTPSP
jgi:hypothetical protein